MNKLELNNDPIPFMENHNPLDMCRIVNKDGKLVLCMGDGTIIPYIVDFKLDLPHMSLATLNINIQVRLDTEKK